jgi:hypothetical protein
MDESVDSRWVRRSRIKLAERDLTRGAQDGRFKPVPLLDDEAQATETVRELVETGLADDAVSLAAAYGLDPAYLASLLTVACLDATDPSLQAQGLLAASLGAEARQMLSLRRSDAWSDLQVRRPPPACPPCCGMISMFFMHGRVLCGRVLCCARPCIVH